MSKYVYKNWALFAIITADARNRIYFQLQAFQNYSQRAFTENERKMFFKHILCSDIDVFHKNANKAPFCAAYTSQTACVGKSYVIQHIANANSHHLIHVPIHSTFADIEFVVDRLLSISSKNAKIIYHIDIPSNISIQINEIMFQLLVLRHLKVDGGNSFHANHKHAFLIELPSQVVFSFFGRQSCDILKYEIEDELKLNPITNANHAIINKMEPTEKQMFVLKYLDAYDKKLLIIDGNIESNWDHEKHENIAKQNMMQLFKKYC
eukprot:138504_1